MKAVSKKKRFELMIISGISIQMLGKDHLDLHCTNFFATNVVTYATSQENTLLHSDTMKLDYKSTGHSSDTIKTIE